ncbi:MAG: hypothetical protein ABGX20_18800 [Bacillus sp. (in: firmicutes)]
MQNLEGWQEDLYKNKDFREDDIIRYKSLQKISNKSSSLKNLMIFLFFLTILINIGIKKFNYKLIIKIREFDFSILKEVAGPNLFISLVISLALNIIVTYCLHMKAYNQVAKACNYKTLKADLEELSEKVINTLVEIKNKIWRDIQSQVKITVSKIKWVKIKYLFISLLLLIISPDYYFAQRTKKKLEKNINKCQDTTCFKDKNEICILEWDEIRISRKFFVELSNWYNVIITILIAAIVIIIWNYEGFIVNILFYFLGLRTGSRCIEIVYAYYRDVVRVSGKTFSFFSEKFYINDWKSSFIRKPARISLAIHTILEMIILFSLIYHFQYVRLSEDHQALINKLISNLLKGEILQYQHFFLYSVSISAFNISFTSYPSLLWSFTHVIQIVLSLVLIILSLAAYIGMKDNLFKREEKFFIEVFKDENNEDDKTDKNDLK